MFKSGIHVFTYLKYLIDYKHLINYVLNILQLWNPIKIYAFGRTRLTCNPLQEP